jgi:hypothetical protein
MEGVDVTASVPAVLAGDDLGDRIRRNVAEGLAARRTGSEARGRADAFVTTSALLTYEVLKASVEADSVSPARAAIFLAGFGLMLPHGRTFHTNVARAVMGERMDSDRLRRVAYAALELLEAKPGEPAAYIRDHGGVGGLAVRRERRLNPKRSSVEAGVPAPEPSCYVLVRATKSATAEQKELAEEHAIEAVPSTNGPMWILPAAAAFVGLIIARAVVPLRHATDPSELIAGAESVVGRAQASRHIATLPSDKSDQPGLPF